MSRPLVISDCDEVLLHMVGPFRDWLAEAHGIHFDMSGGDFHRSMKRVGCDEPLELEEIWRHLSGFFDNEMHRQYPIAGSVAAVAALAEHADVVVLTNLQDHHRDSRARQLAEHGITLRVFTNQGPKGPALKAILDEYGDLPFAQPAGKPLTLVSYRASPPITAHIEPLAVGDSLPDAPLYLTSERHVMVPLEKTYVDTWAACPEAIRELLVVP